MSQGKLPFAKPAKRAVKVKLKPRVQAVKRPKAKPGFVAVIGHLRKAPK